MTKKMLHGKLSIASSMASQTKARWKREYEENNDITCNRKKHKHNAMEGKAVVIERVSKEKVMEMKPGLKFGDQNISFWKKIVRN